MIGVPWAVLVNSMTQVLETGDSACWEGPALVRVLQRKGTNRKYMSIDNMEKDLLGRIGSCSFGG